MKIRPEIGFCVSAEVSGARCKGRMFVNVCSHVMIGFPSTYSGEKATKDYILSRGLAHLQIPLDCGTFRRLKVRKDGSRMNAYAIDVILHPYLVKLFFEDDFCRVMETFRPYFLNLCFTHIEKELGCTLSRKTKLVKKTLYQDLDEDGEAQPLRDIIPEGADSDDDDENLPPPKKKEEAKKEEENKSLIEEVSTEPRKPVMKKGFLSSSKPLYPNGSTEGVLPENAGDPMGWMPKSLRKKCNIVDCNSDQYKKMESEADKCREIDEKNAKTKEWNDELTKDLNKWSKKHVDDKRWQEDNPCGKYSNDYSRFEFVDSDDEEAQKRSMASTSTASESTGASKKIGAPIDDVSAKPLDAQDAQLVKDFEDFSKEMLQNASAAAPPGADHGTEKGQSGSCIEKGFLNKPKKALPRATYRLTPTKTSVKLEVDVPGLNSMRDVDLEVTASTCSLRFPIDLAPLEVPWRVNPDSVKAKFSKKNQTLTISADSDTS